MTDLFTCYRDIATCPSTKQSHLEKCGNAKLCIQLWLMTEPSEVQSILHQHSAMLIMLKYLICLRLLECCCFPPIVFTQKQFAESCNTMEKSMGEILF